MKVKIILRHLLGSQSLGELKLGSLSRKRQIGTHHQAIVLLILAAYLLPSASLFTAENRTSLRPSTAGTFVTLVVL